MSDPTEMDCSNCGSTTYVPPEPDTDPDAGITPTVCNGGDGASPAMPEGSDECDS